MNLLMLFVGCFLDTIAAITILVPILLPLTAQFGIDPVHFGLIMTLNLMIGLLHPPLGMVLFVLSRVAKLSVERTTMAILPWLCAAVHRSHSDHLRSGCGIVAAAVRGTDPLMSGAHMRTRLARLYGPRDLRLEVADVPARGWRGAVEDGRKAAFAARIFTITRKGDSGPVRVREPIIPGHEASGRVAALGGRRLRPCYR